ncbi:hypothetical protein CJ026_025660 [Ralstonia pickettii]|nr:hypothetical protein CJ026_025660 [Ralstonia pickettii]
MAASAGLDPSSSPSALGLLDGSVAFGGEESAGASIVTGTQPSRAEHARGCQTVRMSRAG